MIPLRARLAAAVALLATFAPGALVTAQDANFEGPLLPDDLLGSRATGQGVVASVNGVPITSSDVAYMAQRLEQTVDPAALQFVRRQIAEQILLAKECERLGVTLTDEQVAEYWKVRSGVEFDFEATALQVGTTVERVIELARRSALAEIYTLHKVGLRGDWGHRIKPDPELQRLVSVTPRDLRAYFNQFRDDFDEPPLVHYAVYPCPGPEAAKVIKAALEAGELPNDRKPVRETIPVSEIDDWFVFSGQLIEFLHTATPSMVSDPYVSEDGTLVVQLLERTEGQEAEFAEVQAELRRRLQASLMNRARQLLVDELVREAVYWPADLFERQAPPNPGTLRRGAEDR